MSVLTAARWLAVLAATATAVAGAAAILSLAGSGGQPWDPELSDDFVFMKAIPFLLALGVTLGLVRHRAARRSERRPSDGAIRRFSPGTVAWHWIITIGFLLALPTGVWQYPGGILDVSAPVPLYLLYRVHYVGAGVVLLVLKVLDHLGYTLERWPLVSAMVSTWLGEGYVRLRHPAWYRTVEGPAMRPGPRAGGAGASERAPAGISLGRDQ